MTNNIIIVGAMANNFFVYKNFKVGKSLVEKDTNEIIKNIYKKAEDNDCDILIPEDCVVGTNFDGEGKNKYLSDIQKDEELTLKFNCRFNISLCVAGKSLME